MAKSRKLKVRHDGGSYSLNFFNAPRTIPDPPVAVTFTALQTGGVSVTTNSEGIVLTFSEDLVGLEARHIELTDYTGKAVATELIPTQGNAKVWTLAIEPIVEGTVKVKIVGLNGYSFTEDQTDVDIFAATFVTFTAEQTGGTEDQVASTGIVFTFDTIITGLTADDITIEPMDGSAKKSTLSGSDKEWTLLITEPIQGDIVVSIADIDGFTFDNLVTPIPVFALPQVAVTFTAVQTGGTEDEADSTAIGLEFNKSIDGLTVNQITLEDDTGSAKKGELTGSETTYSLTITDPVQGLVNVSVGGLYGYTFPVLATPVQVYAATAE